MAAVTASAEERFWAKVDKRGPDECWEWQASLNAQGYGWFWDGIANRMVGAHRWAYDHFVEPLPVKAPRTFGATGAVVCHRCDNPRCVNPAHLRAADQQANIDEAVERERRHRTYVGELNPNAKLTGESVNEIRNRYKGRHGEQSALARDFGVSPSAIRNIVLGERWSAA